MKTSQRQRTVKTKLEDMAIKPILFNVPDNPNRLQRRIMAKQRRKHGGKGGIYQL